MWLHNIALADHQHAKLHLLQAFQLLDSWDAAVRALADAATDAVGCAEGLPVPDGLAEQLKQGAHSLMQRRHELLSSLAASANAAEHRLRQQQLLQAASELAGLVQQWQALPAVKKAGRLALARAAAARSCAYLRCANVVGEGGPAAGQGMGGKKCRRGVWGGCRGVVGEWGWG